MILAASDSRAAPGQAAAFGGAADLSLRAPLSHAGSLKAQKTPKGPV